MAQKQFGRIFFFLMLTLGFAKYASANLPVAYGVALKTSEGKYVVAEENGGQTVNANRTELGPWERFKLYDVNGEFLRSGDVVFFKTGGNNFFQAVNNGGGDINAHAITPAQWESFFIHKQTAGDDVIRSGDSIALSTSSGYYLSADTIGGVTAFNQGIGVLAPQPVTCETETPCSMEKLKIEMLEAEPIVIEDKFNNKCLTTEGSDPNARNIVIYDCNGSTSQMWYSTSTGELKSYDNNLCMDAASSYGNLYAGLCHGGNNQKWDMTEETIRDRQYKECVDVSGYSFVNGNNIYMWGCTGNSNQAWKVRY